MRKMVLLPVILSCWISAAAAQERSFATPAGMWMHSEGKTLVITYFRQRTKNTPPDNKIGILLMNHTPEPKTARVECLDPGNEDVRYNFSADLAANDGRQLFLEDEKFANYNWVWCRFEEQSPYPSPRMQGSPD